MPGRSRENRAFGVGGWNRGWEREKSVKALLLGSLPPSAKHRGQCCWAEEVVDALLPPFSSVLSRGESVPRDSSV